MTSNNESMNVIKDDVMTKKANEIEVKFFQVVVNNYVNSVLQGRVPREVDEQNFVDAVQQLKQTVSEMIENNKPF